MKFNNGGMFVKPKGPRLGASSAEYAILAGLVAIVSIGATQLLGIEIGRIFNSANSTIALNMEAGIGGTGGGSGSGSAPVPPPLSSCYDPTNVGTVGTGPECMGMLIVDRPMLYKASIHEDMTYEITTADGTFTFEDDAMNIFTGQVTDMSDLFTSDWWSGDINYWDVSNVTNFSGTFEEAEFYGLIDQWDVSSAETMERMFWGFRLTYPGAPYPDVTGWDVSNVTNMDEMFYNSPFDQDISGWDVGGVQNFDYMLAHTPFNQDIGSWNVSSATTMSYMFMGANQFNADISGWDVSSVTTMNGTFNSSVFNRDISLWDVSNVNSMHGMFSRSSFNQDIGGWDVSGLTRAQFMFSDNTDFDQDLSNWCTPNVGNTGASNYDDGTSASWIASEKPDWGNCP